jgi:hypothetical protein
MPVYTIPLTNKNQRVQTSLLGVTYILVVRWNALANLWYLDINDVNNAPVLNGVPMTAGVNLLKQFAYLGIGGALVAQNVNNPNLPIGYADLGQTGFLLFVVPSQV